jgi:hypothetical protein
MHFLHCPTVLAFRTLPAAAPKVPTPQHAALVGEKHTEHEDGQALQRAAREKEMLASIALPRVRPARQHRYMKILLVGEDGLGRTTLVRCMMNWWQAATRDWSTLAVKQCLLVEVLTHYMGVGG